MPFLDKLHHWAAQTPDAVAIEVDGDRLSFRELRDAAEARLAAGAPGPAPLTTLALPNGTEFVVQFAAGVAATSRCAVLDPSWPPSVRHTVELQLSHLMGENESTDDAAADGAESAPPDERCEERPALCDGPGESIFLYGFTSGTTSVPKAFARSRESWQVSFAASAEYFGLTADDRTLAPGPFSSSLTLYALCESLYTGAAFVALSSFDVGAALTSLRESAITRLVAVPSVLKLIAERALSADGPHPSKTGLSSIVSAGSKLDQDTLVLLRRWAPHATIFEYYGAAELGFVSAAIHHPDLERSGQADSHTDALDDPSTAVGTPFPGVDVRIQSDAGAPLAAGEWGDIAVRSRLVSNGYAWGDDGEAFQRQGEWCTVGDQGYLDTRTVLHFLGRRADMITTGGHNVYPHEVEAVLRSIPGVHGALATGLPDPRRGCRLVAAVLVNDDTDGTDGTDDTEVTDAARLREACQAQLIAPKRPRAYYALTEMPLTGSGKPSRTVLARWILDGDPRVRAL